MNLPILYLFQELNSFVECNEYFERAKASKITTTNNSRFRELVAGWVSGAYDESPELLVNELSSLLPS